MKGQKVKINRFNKAANRAAWFFTAAVPVYTLILRLGVTESGDTAGIYAVLFKNILTLFGFACVFGASFLFFDTKLPQSAKRLLHVLTLYLASLTAAFIMGNSGRDAREIILFVIIATLLFTVVYTASALTASAVRKLIKK